MMSVIGLSTKCDQLTNLKKKTVFNGKDTINKVIGENLT
jgi:hypothetical protein